MNIDIDEELSELTLSDKRQVDKTILSIDIGVQHLSLVLSTITPVGKIQEIRSIDLVNITQYTHTKCTQEECTLYHTKTFFDWLRHVVQEYNHLFEQADVILIERQPPMGFVVVEQILFGFYRDKAVLVAPNSVHAYHNFQNLDYEQRKTASEIISLPYLSTELLERIKTFDRAHDVTDAILQLLYYLNKTQPKEVSIPKDQLKEEQLIHDPPQSVDQCINYLEKFRYKKL